MLAYLAVNMNVIFAGIESTMCWLRVEQGNSCCLRMEVCGEGIQDDEKMWRIYDIVAWHI